jgi:hypothetical protein
MTFLIRKTSIARTSAYRPETVAFISDAFADADYPTKMRLFWHLHSLETGHVDASRKYSVADAWHALGDEILKGWISEHPGTRPRCWWVHDAPRLNGTDLPEPRRRVGRPGQAVPQYVEADADHLAATGLMPLGGMYESQWSYLLRHNLLERAEQSLALLQPERMPAPVITFDEFGHVISE